MRDTLIKWFTDVNTLLIRLSKGRLGSQLGRQAILVLHTMGRKTGQPHSTPVAYFDYQGKYLLVASNWGREKNADWVLNLRKDPHARIEVKGRSVPVQAHEADAEEYPRLWQYVTGRHAQYAKYQESTTRRIPIVVLEAVT